MINPIWVWRDAGVNHLGHDLSVIVTGFDAIILPNIVNQCNIVMAVDM